jgi:hypothetical protein
VVDCRRVEIPWCYEIVAVVAIVMILLILVSVFEIHLFIYIYFNIPTLAKFGIGGLVLVTSCDEPSIDILLAILCPCIVVI